MSGTRPDVPSRLEEQIMWYSSKSTSNQRYYKRLKAVAITVAASIPVLAALKAPSPVLGACGALIAILEGFQSLNQFHHNWISYRSTAEALKHEKYLWLAGAGPYAGVREPDVLLAERIEALVSTEQAAWVTVEQQANKPPRAPSAQG